MELIDREVTLILLNKAIKQFGENWLQDKLTKNGLLIAKQIVSKQPTIEPVRHGRWENIDTSFAHVYCSECGAVADKHLAKRYKGCPFCLCVMDSTDTDDRDRGGILL